MGCERDIKVSVICMTYNHQKFLKKCLDSLVSQNTDFDYEIIVHDDCSTDGTIDIVKEYALKYPEKIVPLYETENQYSQGISPSRKVIPFIRGQYVAICEGDDYWCDNEKIKIQYEYMASHPRCSMVVHNTVKHDLLGASPDVCFFDWQRIHLLAEREVFFGWHVHTSSYFLSTELYKLCKLMKHGSPGDYVILTIAYDKGQVVALPQVMSVYNYNNVDGVTVSKYRKGSKYAADKMMKRARYLEEYNILTEGRHKAIVKERIDEVDFQSKLLVNKSVIFESKSIAKKKYAAQEISSHPYYRQYYRSQNIKGRIVASIIYSFPVKRMIWCRLLSYIRKRVY